MKQSPTVQAALAFAIVAAGLALPAMPLHAQAVDRVLTIFGDDKCPTSNGEEIVVCQRLPERERFRIPENLRSTTPVAGNESWSDRAQSLEYVGRSGTGSCSAEGGGGMHGCWQKLMREAKAERKATAAAQGDRDIP